MPITGQRLEGQYLRAGYPQYLSVGYPHMTLTITFLFFSHDCPGHLSVDQTVFELGDLPASASQVLGLKVCTAA